MQVIVICWNPYRTPGVLDRTKSWYNGQSVFRDVCDKRFCSVKRIKIDSHHLSTRSYTSSVRYPAAVLTHVRARARVNSNEPPPSCRRVQRCRFIGSVSSDHATSPPHARTTTPVLYASASYGRWRVVGRGGWRRARLGPRERATARHTFRRNVSEIRKCFGRRTNGFPDGFGPAREVTTRNIFGQNDRLWDV